MLNVDTFEAFVDESFRGGGFTENNELSQAAVEADLEQKFEQATAILEKYSTGENPIITGIKVTIAESGPLTQAQVFVTVLDRVIEIRLPLFVDGFNMMSIDFAALGFLDGEENMTKVELNSPYNNEFRAFLIELVGNLPPDAIIMMEPEDPIRARAYRDPIRKIDQMRQEAASQSGREFIPIAAQEPKNDERVAA